MLRVGVYLESSLHGALGGAQTHAAVLLEFLSRSHAVDLIVRSADFSAEELARASSTDLTGVKRVVAGRTNDDESPVFSGDYDVFVAFVHDIPPICPARVGVLMVLFPLSRERIWPWCGGDSAGWLRRKSREAYYELLWRRRLSGYQVKTANSEFTRRWTKVRWGVDSTVVYPPVDLVRDDWEKKDLIISVGRYTSQGLSKNQREMLSAYGDLKRQSNLEWDYCCAGAVSNVEESQRYFQECLAIASGSGAQLVANVESARLRRLYAESKILWHAAGYTHDEQNHPEKSEHFGMVTVEAMASGCVPVVIRRGGQPEIVEHDCNGYLWDTLDELQDYTARLAADPRKLRDLAGAAAERAKHFSRSAFVKKMSALLAPYLS